MSNPPAPYYTADGVTLWLGDSLDVLPTLADASVDAIVTDPPYGLEFMGKDWDAPWRAMERGGTLHDPSAAGGFQDGNGGNGYSRSRVRYGRGESGESQAFGQWCEQWARECLRVLKPGGHLVAFGGTRTYHRLACAIEDAGFEVRDSLHWLYGSGFPKSLDVAKAIDKAAGAQREVVGRRRGAGLGSAASFAQDEWTTAQRGARELEITAPATDDAARWQGWGTALKPAHEPIVLARKPLAGTVAANVLTHDTGALNIDGCRVPGGERPVMARTATIIAASSMSGTSTGSSATGETTTAGRWPSNVILTHPPLVDEHGNPVGDACADGCVPGCPVAELDAQSGIRTSGKMRAGTKRSNRDGWAGPMPATTGAETYGDSGGASRFFPVFRYEAKAPASERPRLPDGTAHPTVKPIALMRWLVRLITPPGGTVLDPFTGTGPTLEAARLEGFTGIGIEREQPHAELCRIRLDKPHTPPPVTEPTRIRARAARPAPEQDALFDEIA